MLVTGARDIVELDELRRFTRCDDNAVIGHAVELADERFSPRYRKDRPYPHALTDVATKVVGTAEAPVDAGRRDFEDVATRNHIVDIEHIADAPTQRRQIVEGDTPFAIEI